MRMKSLFAGILFCLLAIQPTRASFDFAVADSTLLGSFTTSRGLNLTLACWIKLTNHPNSVDYILTLAKDSELNEFVSLQLANADDRYQSAAADATAASQAFYSAGVGEYDATWVGLVSTFGGLTERDIFVEVVGNTAENTISRDVSTALVNIHIGEAPNAFAELEAGLVAECAMWDVELADASITSYLGGTCAADIENTDLIGYWPMDAAGATQINLGVDATGDLTVSNATFDADHPTITCSGGVVPITVDHARRRTQ